MRHREDNMQIACVSWFMHQYHSYAFLLHHSPNGGARSESEGARFKEMGVRKGFPDLILLIPNRHHPYLCLELKTDKGRQSESQRYYQQLVTEAGGLYVVIRSKEEFASTVKAYLADRDEELKISVQQPIKSNIHATKRNNRVPRLLQK